MKKLIWLTHTNIDTRKVISARFLDKKDRPCVSFDLTEFIKVFSSNKLWRRKKYRNEYKDNYDHSDIEKIKNIKIDFHSNGPYSNAHNYEYVIDYHLDLNNYELSKISASNISLAQQIAVITIEFDSSNQVMNYLTYEEEKNIDIVFEKHMSKENFEAWQELKKIKSLICEFIQFFIFNLHLAFMTTKYDFSFTNKPMLSGFTSVIENNSFSFELDQIDFLAHYIFYEEEKKDVIISFMKKTSLFWHKEITSIHFFLDALKGSHVTSTNFIKLVFTVESFFGENISLDYITLVLPIILYKDTNQRKKLRETLRIAFNQRNNIVHGNKIIDIEKEIKNTTLTQLFFEIKNIIIRIFHFYIDNEIYINKTGYKISHELIFHHLSQQDINKNK